MMGQVLQEVMGEYKLAKGSLKRRNSAQDRIQMPMYANKQIKRFLVDNDSVAESDRKKMIQNYEENRKDKVEWRAQHTNIKVQEEDLRDKKAKKRAKSEAPKIQDRYLDTVTKLKVDQNIKQGKYI